MARRSQNESGYDFAQAYQSLLPKLLALRPSELVRINLGIPSAVTTALNVQPALAELKDRIAAALPETDVSLPEDLASHALALSHAHTQFMTALQGSDALPSLAAEGTKLRELLVGEVQTLIRRGQTDAEVLRGLRTEKGYRNLAFDLQLLTQVFRRPPASKQITSVTAAEIQHADKLAKTILTLIARRKKLRVSIEEAADLRKRAYTLFTRSYDEARRVAVYLCWREGDADELVPLLHANHGGRPKKRSKNTTREVQ